MPVDTVIKQPYERRFYGVDFASALATGETLSSATCTITDLTSKADVSSTMGGTPSAAISGTVAQALIKGGTTGTKYDMSIRVITSLGQYLETDLDVSVVEDT
jgi:hypothetical protein